MLTIKFEKDDAMKYISHLDLLRQITRVLRRAKIDVKFSQGFNPHEILYFSPPTIVGLHSTCEYVTVATDEPKDTVIERFNAFSPSTFKATECFCVPKNPNLAAVVSYATYEIEGFSDVEKIKNAFEKDAFEITYLEKGEQKTKEVRMLMHAYSKKGDKLYVTLASGNSALRIDRFMSAFCDFDGLTVTKTKQFVSQDGKTIEADDYLRELENNLGI